MGIPLLSYQHKQQNIFVLLTFNRTTKGHVSLRFSDTKPTVFLHSLFYENRAQIGEKNTRAMQLISFPVNLENLG